MAGLRKDTDELKQKTFTLGSEIEVEREARIREIMTLKDDGKLLSVEAIRLLIIEENQKMEDRLVKRLK